jgi:peptidyl-prolyl cis-trans isomerase B (cyclophilin B)
MKRSTSHTPIRILCIGLALTLLGAAPADKKKEGKKPLTAQNEAVLETKLGKIVIEFLPSVAPKTVENFKKLASEGLYNGTTFHRVIPGFMIQGGDPNSKNPDRSKHGFGGPGYTIKAEFSKEKHSRGAVSMARSQDPDSAGSQFFIVVKDSNFLDGQYTVFGRVKEGMDVADKIVAAPKDRADNPVERIEMKVSLR